MSSPSEQQQFNDGANFWRYDVGVPPIPGIFKSKRPAVPWEGYQEIPPTDEQHKIWLDNGDYKGGVMILCGRACYRKDREELYLVGIDIDRQKGIDAFCTGNGKTISLQDIAQQTLVEQHEDCPDKAHIFVYSPFKFRAKGPDEILGIEIKSSWDHGLIRVYPSITEKGYPLKIIGAAREPHVLNEQQATELLQHLDQICISNGVEYLEKKGDNSGKSSYLTPELRQVIKSRSIPFDNKDRPKILIGYRNQTLISVANSVLFTHLHSDRRNEDELKKFFFAINHFLCDPRLPDEEAEAIWASAIKWAYPRILNRGFEGAGPDLGKEEERKKREEQQKQIQDLKLELEEKYYFKTLKDTEEIYFYDGARGIFVSNGEVIIKGALESVIGHNLTNKDVSEFLGHIQRSSYFDRSGFNPNIEWLACKNCMINLKTLETRPFSHEFLATVQIPVEYSADRNYNIIISHCLDTGGPYSAFWRWVQDPLLGPCPAFTKFLYEIMTPQDVEYILDLLAYCLWRDYPFQIFVILNGKGSNGKSTLLSFIKNFFGHRNVSGESLYRLSDPNNRFVTAQLFGKLVNVDADISKIKLEDTGIIKKLTGRDEIFGEIKFRSPFSFPNYAKLIFSTNYIPETPDESDAYFRRQKIIDFKKQFWGPEVDVHLLEKLITSREKSGVLSIILKRLPRILKEGIQQTTDDSIASSYQKYVVGSDPMRAFYEDAIEPGKYSGYKVSPEELFEAYIKFCVDNSVTPQTKGSFKRVWGKDPYGYEFKRDSTGDRKYYWIGMKLKESYKCVSPEQGQSTIFGTDE